MPDSGMQAKQGDSLLGGRKWLDQLRVDAASALVTEIAPFSPDWEPADMHEDIREALLPFFDKLNEFVERHEQRAASHTPQESDLVLGDISERAALILSNAAADEEISHSHAVELRDTIGDLIGEVERLLVELNRG